MERMSKTPSTAQLCMFEGVCDQSDWEAPPVEEPGPTNIGEELAGPFSRWPWWCSWNRRTVINLLKQSSCSCWWRVWCWLTKLNSSLKCSKTTPGRNIKNVQKYYFLSSFFLKLQYISTWNKKSVQGTTKKNCQMESNLQDLYQHCLFGWTLLLPGDDWFWGTKSASGETKSTSRTIEFLFISKI